MITIVDYGMGNLRSVQKGFERVGFEATIADRPEEVRGASKLVLPGVGAFGDAMENLRRLELVEPILDAADRGTPLLGICLGLQLFFEESEEQGLHRGLGLLKGKVRRFSDTLTVPQIGWNQIHIQREHPLLKDIPDGSFLYFVHSYYVDPEDHDDTVALTDYGMDYTSIASKGHLYGVQFHPEKSQDLGLRILENFGSLSPSG